jgi:hypothetical protein
MKFFIVLLALTAVIAVPVTQVPETVAAPVAVAPVAAAPVVAAPVAAETKAVEVKVETPAVAETKVETPAVEAKKTESTIDEVKGQALSQVMKAITDLSAPLAGEEFNLLKEVMSKGANILAQAEEKANMLKNHGDFQNLVQSDSLFGIKTDGTIDADVATEHLTQLMSLITGTKMSTQEKTLVHDLIGGFSGLFAPLLSGSDPMQADLEKIAQQFTNKFDKLQTQISNTPKDKLLEPQTLLSVMTSDNEGIDTQLLSQVTEKFMDRVSSQFEKAMGTLEKFQAQA